MHDNIQPAELDCGVLNSRRSAVRSFQVERQGNRRQALLLKSIGNRLGSAQGAIGCRDESASLGEAVNNRWSNGATHSGHQCFSACESLVRHDELRLMPVLIKNSRVGCAPRATRGSVSASWR